MEPILRGLNEQQKCAVTSPAPVLQVLAPPGSGKTKTLTARVAYLIAQEGLKPWNMIVCTFTIKAAREMKERIRNFVGDKLEAKLVLGTFHSVARRYLVTYGQRIGVPKNFGIADSSDSLAIIKRIIKRHDFTTEPAKARSRISKRKSGSMTTETANSKQNTEQQEFEAIYSKYEEALEASNLLDYDDLLLRCVELLKRFPECVSNIEAVLIDEFQDTNNVQYELMSLFAQHRKPNRRGKIPGITIVGDPDQSIYSFRSAEIKNLRRMAKQYLETQIVLLEENYRSSGSILQSALEVIEQDESRPPKKLLATHTIGERPVLRTLPSSAAEAAWIVAELQRITILTGGLFNFSDFAILLRSASLSRHIETSLGKAGIPYRMVGGHKFFDRVEVKILLDYLRVISQPDHNDALARVVNVPPRKIGDITVKALLEEAEKKKKTLWDLVLDIAQGRRKANTKLSAQAQKGLEVFANIILTSQKKLQNSNESCTIYDLLAHILKKLCFEEFLRKSYGEDFDSRWANVEELSMLAIDRSSLQDESELDEEALFSIDGVEQQQSLGAEEKLTKFLANVALSTEVETQNNTEEAPKQVTISTIHAAKGLEWPVVFIPAVYEGSIPHSRAEDTDEERRLLYVGMTRAKTLLYLSWPKKNSSSESTTLSPFLSTRTMARYFEGKGPAFGFSVTQELARILGRDCPSNEAINFALSTIEQAEDDHWPEDGEEPRPGVARWSAQQFGSDTWSSNYSSNPLIYDPPFKRQKISRNITTPLPAIVTTSSEAYSISNNTVASSFMSASVRMKEIEATRELEGANRKGDKGTQESKKGKAKATGHKTQKPGQGNLLNFFTQPSSKPQYVETSHEELPLPRQISRQPRASGIPQMEALHDVSNTRARSMVKHPAVPPSFAAHKPRSLPSSGRPTRSFNEEISSQKYILLSSSPTKPDDVGPRQTAEDDSGLADSPSKGRMTQGEPQQGIEIGGFMQASTFHTTTMARLENGGQQQRKTLGMRRSVQGWSSRVNQPFSAPSRRKG